MSTPQELQQQVVAQGDVVRSLKAEKADPAKITDEVKKLQELKAKLGALSLDGEPGKSSKGKKGKTTLKTPKGTKDWQPEDMALRNHMFKKITEVFELHGGVTIDTPVFELREILTGKYGEDSKLIYDLQDQGGEICSLRYDLTVPFARWLAMYGQQYPNIKRYHLAKVYRRDQPAMTKGRMREFYQCDIDIAGSYDAMLPDAECVSIACDVLKSLEITEFTVKVNHRKLLDGIFEVCGVPEDKTRAISSAVDKMDKLPWEEVKAEMTEQKGLDPAVADQIGTYVKLKGGPELVEKLTGMAELVASKKAKEGLADLKLLFEYLEVFGCVSSVSLDLSLARGLDYYTGIIYEAVTEGSAPPSQAAAVEAPKKKKKAGDEEELDESAVGVGSIAGGGRYDNLVGMFSSSNSIPCVGISFGIERLFALLSAKAKEAAVPPRGKPTEVYVMNVGSGLLKERMQICADLWAAGIKAEYMYKKDPKPKGQFEYVDKYRIPLVVFLGPEDWQRGEVKVKEQVGKEEAGQDKGNTVKRSELVEFLQARIKAQQ